MNKLTNQEKQNLIKLIKEGKTIPSFYKSKLFDSGDSEFVEVTKDYKLIYKGKESKEKIIANTPSVPLQKVRSFNCDNPFEDGWKNMLIFGDNLLAIKAIYDDQRGPNIFKTKNKIKLIYIDPPFATKQDFMKDREKAYRDKIIGAQFIEFLRKRLILLREILADDGSIYVHLDWKKGHYIKAVMDEVFGEHNYLNEIVWKGADSHNDSKRLAIVDNKIFWYAKNDSYFYEPVYVDYSEEYINQFYNNKEIAKDGTVRRYRYDHFTKPKGSIGYFYEFRGCQPPPNGWRCPIVTMQKWDDKGLLEVKGSRIYKRRYLDEQEGKQVTSVWSDITGQLRSEDTNYPTQKPERLLSRIIRLGSKKNHIILDAFGGGGTTLSVSEKLGRKWIGIDCGKLSIYTIQKRMLNLTTQIGTVKKDTRREHGRTEYFEEHLKSSRGLFLITEKARKGELIVSDSFLKNFAEFIDGNLKGGSEENISLCLPESKFKIKELEVFENDEGATGEKSIKVGRVNFLISFIKPKEKSQKEKPLKAKEFTLYNAGIYDNETILNLDWNRYKPFVMQLFNVREDEHKIHGHTADGYIGTYDAYIWNYPDQKNLTLDRGYVESLHDVLGGKSGDKFYVVAPVTAMDFMEDEIKIGNTTYVFLKVPLSVLQALIEKGEAGSLKQPTSEDDVNEVIDAVGFDFISQPVVRAKYYRDIPLNQTLEDQDKKDFVIEIEEFKSNTLVYDPEDFENFETLSMVMIDTDFNDDYFNLSQVYWSDKIILEDKSKAIIRVPQDSFNGNKMMIIYLDKYGNELKTVKLTENFDEPRVQKRKSSSKTKGRRKK